MNIAAWGARCGAVLQQLDPSTGPRQVLDRLWAEVATWPGIDGIWFHARPGHLVPSGVAQAGRPIPEIEEIEPLAGPASAPIHSDGGEVVARAVRDGNVPIATVVVAHRDAPEAAAFVVDALARWCLDRLRLQLEVSELSEENVALRGSLAQPVREHDLLTVSGVMSALVRSAVRAAASSATVLINGETGTGKELLARLVHTHSPRAPMPMVTVNLAALSPSLIESELFGHERGAFTGADERRKGLFEVADGGTLFLDEIGEIGPEVQVRLLRVLQERCFTRVGDHRPIPVDVRIIAATHRDLAQEVALGRFREDLFYRLNVVNLQVPPLRRRSEDIPLLVSHFLQKYNRLNYKHVDEVPRRVLEMLCAYPWPGNIRELENCVQKAVVLAPGRVFPEDLVPPTIRSYSEAPPAADPTPVSQSVTSLSAAPVDPGDALAAALVRWAELADQDLVAMLAHVEQILLRWAIAREGGVKARAARRLGINRVTLDRKLAHAPTAEAPAD